MAEIIRMLEHNSRKSIRLKPGQLCTFRGHVYRAKRKTNSCEGCAFNHNVYVCPVMIAKTSKRIDCLLDNIILTKV
mgnify:CR=1 FL=1